MADRSGQSEEATRPGDGERTPDELEAGDDREHQHCLVMVAVRADRGRVDRPCARSEEHTSELQSLMRISYAVFCLKKKNKQTKNQQCNRDTVARQNMSSSK